MDKVFPFEQTNEAISYVETGRAKGKVVVKVKQKCLHKKQALAGEYLQLVYS